MSALLQGVPRRNATGQILFTVGATPPDHFSGGIPYEADGSVAVENGPIDHYHQGLPYTASGRLATGGGTVVTYYGGGAAAFAANGQQATSTLPDVYVHGVAYGANGAPCWVAAPV